MKQDSFSHDLVQRRRRTLLARFINKLNCSKCCAYYSYRNKINYIFTDNFYFSFQLANKVTRFLTVLLHIFHFGCFYLLSPSFLFSLFSLYCAAPASLYSHFVLIFMTHLITFSSLYYLWSLIFQCHMMIMYNNGFYYIFIHEWKVF